MCNCYPLAPRRLVYPELLPADCLYNTDQQLFKKLKNLAKHPHIVERIMPDIPLDKYSGEVLEQKYLDLFLPDP